MSIDRAAVSRLSDRARREVDDGLLPSCQWALGYEGEVVELQSYGEATDESRFVVFSATKPFVASVVWQLIAEGLIDPGRRVVEYFPEFALNGKDVITIEQVMLHMSGFPLAPLGPPAWSTRESRQQAMANWRLNWAPGTRFEYHPTSAHWVLAELIDIVTGSDYRDELFRRVTAPLGLGRLLGVSDSASFMPLEPVGELASPQEIKAAFGVAELPAGEVTTAALTAFNDPAARAVGVPGGGGVMGAEQIVRFYQELLHNRLGLWPADLLADVTSRVRNRLPDPLTNTPANRSLGLVLAGDDDRSHFRGMGRKLSPGAFGHNGAAGQIAWADPVTGLSFAYLTNGVDQHIIREPRRTTALASLAALCAVSD